MDAWTLALLIGAVVTAIVSISDNRALLWIALGVVDFSLTGTYARHAVPWMPAAFFTGMMDASVALLLITFAQRKWEGALGYIFEFMMMTSFIRLMGLLPDHFVYVVTLELANWAALLVVGGSAIARRVDAYLPELVGALILLAVFIALELWRSVVRKLRRFGRRRGDDR